MLHSVQCHPGSRYQVPMTCMRLHQTHLDLQWGHICRGDPRYIGWTDAYDGLLGAAAGKRALARLFASMAGWHQAEKCCWYYSVAVYNSQHVDDDDGGVAGCMWMKEIAVTHGGWGGERIGGPPCTILMHHSTNHSSTTHVPPARESDHYKESIRNSTLTYDSIERIFFLFK